LSALTKPVGFVVGRPSHASSIGISVISVKNQNNGCFQKMGPTADVAKEKIRAITLKALPFAQASGLHGIG
jgi:hypothetical protein